MLSLVEEFGAAAAVVVTLIRKCTSMMLSFVIWPKPLSSLHIWCGAPRDGGTGVTRHANLAPQKVTAALAPYRSSSQGRWARVPLAACPRLDEAEEEREVGGERG